MIEGEGSLTADGNVSVNGEVYEAKAVVLATGSVALPIPGVQFGGRVVDTWGAWSLTEQPAKIAVVGAGASGSEIASAYARLGTEVILIEMLPQILPAEDKDIAKVVERVFKKQGIEISTGAPVENVEVGEGSVKFTYGDKSAEVDYLCVAGGRAPDTEGLGLEPPPGSSSTRRAARSRSTTTGARPTRRSSRSATWSTRRPSPTRPRRRASSRSRPRAASRPSRSNQELLVGATFTHPQVASVGLTEAAAKEAGHEVKIGKQKISGEGAGTVYDDKDGIVKLVVDARYGEILGAHIVGNRACDMIAELVAVMALEGGAEEVARIVHPHPTVWRRCSTPRAPSTAGRSTPEPPLADPFPNHSKVRTTGWRARSGGHRRRAAAVWRRSPARSPAPSNF